jgi:alkylhydroperoxidase/carboxymuconolactone decarboxylase family protein YurZ
MSWTPALPPRESVRADEREAYDRVLERQLGYGYADFVGRFLHKDVLRSFPGDRVQPYFAALLNSPLIAGGMSDLGVVYRTRGEFLDGLQHADREWADMVTCTELNCLWVIYVHAPDAVAVGVRPEAILALVQEREEELTEIERLKSNFIRAVARGTMTSELFSAMDGELGTRATVEMVAFCGHTLKTKRLMQAFGVPDITREQLEEFLIAILDGRVELPDPRARVPSRPAHEDAE